MLGSFDFLENEADVESISGSVAFPAELLRPNNLHFSFRDAFGRRLSFKLEEVFKSQQKEEEAQQS